MVVFSNILMGVYHRLTWHIPEDKVMSTTSGSHTGQIRWHQDTAAVLWLIEWWGTPQLRMLVMFLRWVILQGLSVTKIFTQFNPCNHNSGTYFNGRAFNTYTHTHARARTHARTHTHARMRMHACTHTHTPSFLLHILI